MTINNNQVYQIDAVKGMQQLDYDSVDAIILDLPYPFHARKGGPTARCQKWFPSFDGTLHDGWKEAYHDPTTEQEPKFWKWFESLLSQCVYKAKKGSYLIIFATEDYMDKVKATLKVPHIYRRAWIWDKIDYTTGYYGRVQHEFLLVYTLGNTKRYVTNHGTIFRYKRVRGGYPTEKPVPLLKDIIKLITKEGELVVDPCCGSGSTLIAARNLNRNYIGFDIYDEAIKLTNNRLNALDKSNIFDDEF